MLSAFLAHCLAMFSTFLGGLVTRACFAYRGYARPSGYILPEFYAGVASKNDTPSQSRRLMRTSERNGARWSDYIRTRRGANYVLQLLTNL
jgi:hypothetical protein